MTEKITFNDLQKLITPRAKDSHKGNFGHVLVVGGDTGFAGAARLCSEAAARTGAGLTSLATRKEHASHLAMAVPEIMAHPIEDAIEIKPLLNKASVIAIGPGLGQGSWATGLFSNVLETKLPMVVDADALNILAKEPTKSSHWILTPHPGEAARLLNCDTKAIQGDRISSAKELQNTYGGMIVLKGNETVIVDDEQAVTVCADGNPGMATGGMGDVLTGIIAGLMAQKESLNISNSDALKIAVCLHAAAADKAALDGERGMLASDLVPHIRQLLN